MNMIYAISCQNNNIDSMVDDHFSRAPYFCIFNSITKECYFIENKYKESFEKTADKVVSMLIQHSIESAISKAFGQKLNTILKEKKINLIIIDHHYIKTIKQIIKIIDKNEETSSNTN